ncbi:MAG: hypothetical protein WA634_11895 [Silvibacterium sp.]
MYKNKCADVVAFVQLRLVMRELASRADLVAQAWFGAIENAVSSLTGLLGTGLRDDSASRMIALRRRIEV